MKEAFNEVTKKARIKVKFNQNLTKTQLYAHGAQDRDWFLDMFSNHFSKAAQQMGINEDWKDIGNILGDE